MLRWSVYMISVTPLTYLPIKWGIVKSNDINEFKSWQSLLIYALLSLNLHWLDSPRRNQESQNGWFNIFCHNKLTEGSHVGASL